MDTETLAMLNRIYAATDALQNLEGQDTGLVIEMSQAMLNDVIEHSELSPMIVYVRRYCDVYNNDEMAQEIADDI
jgi:hypothetical protein